MSRKIIALDFNKGEGPTDMDNALLLYLYPMDPIVVNGTAAVPHPSSGLPEAALRHDLVTSGEVAQIDAGTLTWDLRNPTRKPGTSLQQVRAHLLATYDEYRDEFLAGIALRYKHFGLVLEVPE